MLSQRETTCMEKYGALNYVQTLAYIEKYHSTCLEKYGVIHYSKTKECQEKRNHTLKVNNTYNSSNNGRFFI